MGAILGLSRVEGHLKKYLRDKESGIVEVARISQSMIANSARGLSPVLTGALQHSIQEGPVILRGEMVTATVVALQDYASYVEKGTSRQKAQPFLRPAMDRHKSDFIRLLLRVLRP